MGRSAWRRRRGPATSDGEGGSHLANAHQHGYWWGKSCRFRYCIINHDFFQSTREAGLTTLSSSSAVSTGTMANLVATEGLHTPPCILAASSSLHRGGPEEEWTKSPSTTTSQCPNPPLENSTMKIKRQCLLLQIWKLNFQIILVIYFLTFFFADRVWIKHKVKTRHGKKAIKPCSRIEIYLTRSFVWFFIKSTENEEKNPVLAVTNLEAQFTNCSSFLFLPFFFDKRIWIKHKVKTRQGKKAIKLRSRIPTRTEHEPITGI